MKSNFSAVAARRGREPIGLYRGRSKRARLSASYRTAFFIELLGPTLAFPTSAI